MEAAKERERDDSWYSKGPQETREGLKAVESKTQVRIIVSLWMGHLHSLTLARGCEGSRCKFVGGKLDVEGFHARAFHVLWELEGTATC